MAYKLLDAAARGPRSGLVRGRIVWGLFGACFVVGAIATGCDKVVLSNSPATVLGTLEADAGTVLTRESHGIYFPIGLGSFHVNQTCDDCHGGFSDFKQFTCVSCHAHAVAPAAARHVQIAEYQFSQTGCLTCHPNGREAQISAADHSAKYFPIETGLHSGLQCADCHNWVTTSRPFLCTSCHTHAQDVLLTNHTNITGYRYDTTGVSCYGCHPTGTEAPIATSDHSAQFFPILTGSHANMACSSCHLDATTSKTFTCTTSTCHSQAQSQTQHATVTGYVYGDAQCYSCHPQDSNPS